MEVVSLSRGWSAIVQDGRTDCLCVESLARLLSVGGREEGEGVVCRECVGGAGLGLGLGLGKLNEKEG